MHTRIDQLLNLRDGEPEDAQAASHVAQCAQCSAELLRLTSLRRTMQEMPAFEAPPWERIRDRLSAAPARRSRHSVAVVAAGTAALSIATGWLLSGGGHEPEVPVAEVELATSDEALPGEDLSELMSRSRRLEEMLRVLPARPVVERVTTAATIDTLEQRIQWLDFHLSYAPEAGLSERQAEYLWRERVDLMDSLVKVRYAESGYMSF